jgi:crotonobetaine/carnitine-CoA ligase
LDSRIQKTSPLTVPGLVTAAAERYGNAPFLATATDAHTFAQAADRIARIAGWFRAHGVASGDRILIRGGNTLPTIEAWLGAIHAGAIPAATNPALTEPEFAYVLDDLRPALALVAAGDEALGWLGRDVRYGGLDAELGTGHVGENAAPIAPHLAAPEDVAAIVYTSGTTSRPKGAQVRHLAYVGAGQSMPTWLGFAGPQRLWCVLPFFHINAEAYSLMTALANGYPMVVGEKFRASTFWRDAAALDVTAVNLIGAMLAILEKQPIDLFVPGALRTIYAAPALEPSANRAFEARFGVRIVAGFGMSETTFGTIETPTSRNKAGSIGRARQHPAGLVRNDLRIVTPEGAVARDGEVGELQFRNPAMTPGYWNAPEITARTLADGWLHTGDAGYVDPDGDVILVGRYKEMIRRRGENIAPREVEDVLVEHPAVRDAAVIGVPSTLSEEDVVACVILEAGRSADEAELRGWCAQRLAPYKVPLRVVFRDAFPLTPTMRVAKDRLRAEVLPLLAQGAPT